MYYHDPTWFNFEYTPGLWEGHSPEDKEIIERTIKLRTYMPQLKWD